MKATPLRNAAALAALLALGACGGKASFDITGNITDSAGAQRALANAGLVLVNGSDRLDVPVGATTFKFAHSISYGTEYVLSVAQQPRHMTCGFLGGATGTAGRTAVISATLSCTQNAYTIGGEIKGLGSGTLVLVNGTDKLSVTTALANFPNFVMPAAVADGSAYGVSVLTPQPDGQTCSVVNGSGVMGENLRTDVVVTCVNN